MLLKQAKSPAILTLPNTLTALTNALNPSTPPNCAWMFQKIHLLTLAVCPKLSSQPQRAMILGHYCSSTAPLRPLHHWHCVMASALMQLAVEVFLAPLASPSFEIPTIWELLIAESKLRNNDT